MGMSSGSQFAGLAAAVFLLGCSADVDSSQTVAADAMEDVDQDANSAEAEQPALSERNRVGRRVTPEEMAAVGMDFPDGTATHADFDVSVRGDHHDDLQLGEGVVAFCAVEPGDYWTFVAKFGEDDGARYEPGSYLLFVDELLGVSLFVRDQAEFYSGEWSGPAPRLQPGRVSFETRVDTNAKDADALVRGWFDCGDEG